MVLGTGRHEPSCGVPEGLVATAARPHRSMDAGGTETSVAQPTAEVGAECDLDQLLQYMAVQALNRVAAGQGLSFTVQGKLGATPVTVMFDSGAIGGDFVSEALVNQHH